MSALASATQAASSIRSHIEEALSNPEAQKPQTSFTDAEIEKSRAMRQQIQVNIDTIVTSINGHLVAFADPVKANAFPAATLPVLRDPSVDPNLTLKDDTENGLSGMAQTSQSMSTSIETIMQSFNTILALNDIEKFSGTLESVPTVGILGNNIMYAQKKFGSNNQVVTQWQILDALPKSIGNGESTNLYSYNGNLYVAVGTAVYYKAPRNIQDPQILQAATDNWANMYNQGWSLSSQTSLPDATSRSLVPFNSMSADGKTMNSWLVRVANDFSLSYASGAITDNNSLSFASLTYSPTAKYTTSPQLQKAAYYMNSIWGYDSSNTLWELMPNFSNSTYTVASTESVPGTLSDLTAVDTGIVGAMADGNLWAREISPPKDPQGSGSVSTASWKIIMQLNGVQSLGAASPGMVLDIKTLTAYLKSQYTDTQVNLIPVINQIIAFTASHKQYLNTMAAQSAIYTSTTSTPQQQALALSNGTLALNHAKLYARILSQTLNSAQGTVVDITRQTSQIKKSINVQLSQIATSLTALNATLQSQEADLDSLTIGLWASVASVVVGIGLIIGGFFVTATVLGAPLGVLMWGAGGAMVVGGMIAVGVVAAKRVTAQAAVNSTQSAITSVMKQQTELQTINGHFDDLTSEYASLNSFWGNLYSTSQQINDIELLGAEILSDISSIQGAQVLNDSIATQLTQYLTTLFAQGIRLPPDTVNFIATMPNDFQTLDHTELASLVDSHHNDAATQKRTKLTVIERLLNKATESLVAKDHQGYISLLSKAASLSDLIHG